MTERLQLISDRACEALAQLIKEAESQILDAQTKSEKEAELQGKKRKFKLSFRITIDEAAHTQAHDLAWSVGQKRSKTDSMPDPNQDDLPLGEPAEPVDPEANPRRRRGARKGVAP